VTFEYGPCADPDSNTPGRNDQNNIISGLEPGWYTLDYKINYDQGSIPMDHTLMVQVLVDGIDHAGDFKSIGTGTYDMVNGSVTVECTPTTKIQVAVIHTKASGDAKSPPPKSEMPQWGPSIGNYMPVGPDAFVPITARLQIRYVAPV
jgi:hypothetical protein